MSGTPPGARVAAVVLAAGRSTRAGAINKLTAEVAGKAIVAHVADTLLAGPARPVIVVTGHEAAAVRAALAGRDVTFAHNPRYAEGVSTSIAAGIAAVPEDCTGALVALGDMPGLAAGDVARLLAAFDGSAACVPVAGGRRGNPVVFPRASFARLLRLEGDAGARALLASGAFAVREVPLEGTGTLADLDTEAEIAAWRRGRGDAQE